MQPYSSGNFTGCCFSPVDGSPAPNTLIELISPGIALAILSMAKQ